MKPELRAQARRLREQGRSFADIQVQVPVSKGTLSAWLRDMPLTPDQVSGYRAKAALSGSAVLRERRKARWKLYTEEAESEWSDFHQNPRFMFGLALYAGEGDKTGHYVGMSNSDPRILR